MNKIEKLIKELCPNGVEWKKLEEVCDIVSGKDYKHLQNGNIPVYGSGGIMTFVNKSAYDKPTVLLPRKGSISNVFYVNGPFWNVDTIYYTKIYEHIIDTKYLFYYLQREHIEKYCTSDAARPALTRECLSKIQIPLPPLPIQTEIVRILDKFVEQQEQLERLIELRKKQYEYYREELLKPKEGWETKTLGEICNLFTGGEPPINCIKGDKPNDVNKYPIYANGADVYGYADSYKIEEDAVCISSIGANTGAIFFHKGKFTPIIRLKVLVPKNESINCRYLYYSLQKANIKPKDGGIPNINANDVKKLNVEIPSIEIQNWTIEILSNFEFSIASLKSALEASKNRYEYYRDKMMRF